MNTIVPAVLPASRDELMQTLDTFAGLPPVPCVQIDVVDSQFATPASWPYTAPEELRELVEHGALLPHTHRFAYEMDLMCLDAARAADAWLALGATRLTFHIEGLFDPARTLAQVQARHGRETVSYGLALNIATDVLRIESYLDRVDYVQFMGIATIGKQGQHFDRRVLDKIRAFRTRYPEVPVQVDGGVSPDTAPALLALGVHRLIVGSALLRADDPTAVLQQLEDLGTATLATL